MPERFRVVCTIKALYKCSDLPLPLPLQVYVTEGHSTVLRKLVSVVQLQPLSNSNSGAISRMILSHLSLSKSRISDIFCEFGAINIDF